MKLFYRIVIIIVFATILGAVIAYARGYRFDMEKRSVSSTGILAISSNPKAAKVFVNGVLKGVTDLNVTLPPGNYSIDIKKDGFTSWNKKVSLKGELVMSLDSLLFPLNPSLSPLTNLGVFKAIPLDQTDKILIFTDNSDETKDGIYLFEAGKKPLTFFSPLKLLVLKKNLPSTINYRSAAVIFSPDFKQGIVEFDKTSYLLSLEEENNTLFDITTSRETLIEAWTKEKTKIHIKILETYPKEILKVATDSFQLVAFSPNETKILYKAKQNLILPLVIDPPLIATNQTQEVRTLKKDHLYIYDKKEDKNYEILTNQLPTINSTSSVENTLLWFPDSKHIVFNEGKRISILEFDGNNKQTVYSGPYDESFYIVTGDSNLIIMSNLNPESNKFPDLYAVGIK